MATPVEVGSGASSEIVTPNRAQSAPLQDTVMPEGEILSETDLLVDAAICDGRFLAILREQPREVAVALGRTISDQGAHQLAITPLRDSLNQLYRAKFGKRSKNESELAFPEAVVPFIAVGIVVVSIAIVLIVVVTWTITRDRRGKANDRSANRELKM